MNKIITKLSFFGVAAMALTSCSDFLDKEVLSYATDENFYQTRYQIQSALDAAYDVLQSDTYQDSEWRFGEATSDNVIGMDEGMSSQMGQLVNFRFTTSNTLILSRWQVNYKGIHRANQVIYNIDRVKMSTNSYNDYSSVRYIYAQAKFLRAFYYFNLVKTFGGVPIRPERESVEGLVVPRSTKEECYAYIEKDLREAAVMLPVIYNNTQDCGKITKGACVGMLMKVLMYQAKPGVKSEKWEEIVKLGNYFIKGAKLTNAEILKWNGTEDEWEALRKSLWFKPKEENTGGDPYENFDTPMADVGNAYSIEYKDYYGKPLYGEADIAYLYQFYPDGEFCKGSVFEIVFKESADGTSGDTNEGAGLEFFDEGNVKMYANDAVLGSIFGNDVRRDFCIHHQTTTFDGTIWQGGEGRYVSMKWYTPRKHKPQYAGDNGNNKRVLRFVDVKLMYAEALNECGDRENALIQLNELKAQVNTIDKSTKLYVAGGYGYIRDQIWDERRKELAFENDRFWDIVRQGRAAKLLHDYAASRGGFRGASYIAGIHEVFPIPQTEIDVSNGVVEQNPGY